MENGIFRYINVKSLNSDESLESKKKTIKSLIFRRFFLKGVVKGLNKIKRL